MMLTLAHIMLASDASMYLRVEMYLEVPWGRNLSLNGTNILGSGRKYFKAFREGIN